ncbi:glucuronyl hydrolase [Penicillium canescens]|nr:glucuronyl hydrolase [Penicillium canescens]
MAALIFHSFALTSRSLRGRGTCIDLLFYADNYLKSERLIKIASIHATTLLSSHLRKESRTNEVNRYSTYHVVNFSPSNNRALNKKHTFQGYSYSSTWACGQSWAVLGYAKTFTSTKRQDFLDTATGAAEQFIFALESIPAAVEEPQHGGRGR